MTWIVIVSVGIGSYALRALPIFAGGRLLASPPVERLIAHAGTAALAALIATGLRSGAVGGDAAPALVAATAALVVAIRGASMLRVLFAGAGGFAVASVLTALLR